MDSFAALVIGNSLYDSCDSFPRLGHCRGDAEELFTLLTEPPTGLFPAKRSRLQFDLTIDAFRSELKNFFGIVERTDFVFLYFACHGRIVGRGRLFLAMRDSQEDDLVSSAFDVNTL